jgi:threonine/homoserine/homoserine lactone efflux protein
MIFKGFKFGMLLQFAIGPVTVFILQTSTINGFYIAELGVLGVALIDGLFITIAILGIASVIDNKNVKMVLKAFGSIILFIFGLSTVLCQFNINFLPSFNLQNSISSNNVFIHAVILTAVNPLTILFWAGVFSTKIIEENMVKSDVYIFASGALMSTIVFLTIIALIGNFTKLYFPISLIQALNLLVGLLLIYFSFRMFIKKV